MAWLVVVLVALAIVLAARTASYLLPPRPTDAVGSAAPQASGADGSILAADVTWPQADTRDVNRARGAESGPGGDGPGRESAWPEAGPAESVAAETAWIAHVNVASTHPTTAQSGTSAVARGVARYDRSGKAREERVKRFGGNAATEDAVEAGLAWLAAHQSPDGTWDRHEFNRACPAGDRCTGIATNRGDHSLTPGLTGLALLAFLGAGYTAENGPYPEVVRRGVEALLALQQRDGGFSRDDGMAGYNDALATFALGEYAAMTRDPQAQRALRAAVDRLVLSQQDLGGWDYLPDPGSGRNDTSITAWVVQALHACEAAGVAVPRPALVNAATHFARASLPDGRVWYADSGTGFGLDRTTMQPQYRYGAAMTACALTCESLLGWRLDGGSPAAQVARILGELPSAALARGRDVTGLHSEYYWYYGTVAMFQVGGDAWERWNATLRDMILPMQERSRARNAEKRHAFGSWPPYGENWGKWGRMGGRVYSTAIAVLTLEVYYRATPAYLGGEPALTGDDWRAYLADADPRRRLRAVRALREARLEIGEGVLVDALGDPDAGVALAAATSLAALDSPMGRTLMEGVVDTLAPWERGPVERALARVREIERLAHATGRVRLYDPRVRLATLALDRAYVGMELDLLRGRAPGGTARGGAAGQARESGEPGPLAASQPVGRMRVLQRITGRDVVVARWLGNDDDAPAAGDALIEVR